MNIRILQSQKEYLVKCVLQERENLVQDIEKGKLFNNKWEIDITNDAADEIRDLCLEKLQTVGFDEKYKLSRQGKVLEDLIDVFYVSR
ncbi:hypothetical protein [Desulforamulus aeronauticus]|uniref:Uncharacterized protein n=1 Tax=Desulforamulus aeronauticus DSM 10349 TaxID=1121421 RepID=A0A1M6XDV5_9FIRM|nr:hypothetical protein [Desulforamulus aeronauticus]SHL04164.1 hypothetical protein SAMN02745123_03995 [Desulforamulus aeronauticus DSM 10349]